MLVLQLIIQFFKTGLFSIGGGLATIPFLKEMSINYNWFSLEELQTMINVAESTPGPIGVNMATYVGFKQLGLIGGIITTLSLVLPSIIVILIIARVLEKFKNSNVINSVFKCLRAAVLGLIIYAVVDIFKNTLFNEETIINLKQFVCYVVILAGSLKIKKLSPIMIIVVCAVIGIVFAI